MKHLVGLIFALLLGVAGAAGAVAQIRLAMGEILTDGNNTAPIDAQNFRSTLREALARAINKKAEVGSCDIVMIDIDPETVAGINTERMLQEKGYSKKTGEKLGTFVVSDVVHGVVGFDGDGGNDYVVQTDNIASGKTGVAKAEGNVKPSRLAEEADRAAASIVEQLCKHKPYRFQARMNDLVIDALICDPTKPTQFNGKGRTAGLQFTLTPDSPATGKWVVAGSAGGVPWSGGGTYVAEFKEEVGSMAMKGAWSIKTPVGVFPYSGTIKGKLEKLQTTHCGAEN
jgi:hypothetical protein